MMTRFKIGLIISFLLTLNINGFAQLVHPGGWLNSTDLSRIRDKVASGEEPWASAWNDIKNDGAGVNTRANVSAIITSDGAFQSQGQDAFLLAIKWVVTGDKAYATAGINIIDAWVDTVEDFDIKNTPLRQGIGSNMMASAAEILATGFNGEAGWAAADVTKAQNWFIDVIYPYTSTGPSRSMNWGTSCLAGNMSMAIFCDNMTMYNDAIDAYKFGFTNTNDGCAGVTQYIVNEEGQCFESERDQSHAQGGIAHFVEPAMIAWNQGDDLVSYSNYRLVAGMEYSAKYNLGNEVPFVDDYPNPCNVRFDWMNNGFISTDDRGEYSPVYVMAATLFEYAGIDHPYVAQIASSTDYFPEYTNSDHPGMGHLLYSRSTSINTCENTTALIEAECYDAMLGVEKEASEDDDTDNIGRTDNGDWTAYNRIDLTDVYSVRARVASIRDGVSIEVRLDAVDGELLATIPVTNTGAWQTWTTNQVNIGVVDGFHDVYFVFTGGGGGILNVNWFGFSEDFICSNTIDLIEAECYDDMSGIKTEGCSEGTLNVGFVDNGDWLSFENMDLTDKNLFKARVSSKNSGGEIEVRLDNENGQLLGTLPVINTGGWQEWITDSVYISEVTGVHDVVLLFTGGEGSLFNINNLGFHESVVTDLNAFVTSKIALYPNPTSGIVHLPKNTVYSIMNSFGVEVLSGESDDVDLTGFPKGVYIFREQNQVQSIIKL